MINKSHHKSATTKSGSGAKQYEKLLSATPLSAHLAADEAASHYQEEIPEPKGGTASDHPGSIAERQGEPVDRGGHRKTEEGAASRGPKGIGPRDPFQGSESPGLRGSQITTENVGSQGQQMQQASSQYNLNMSQQTFGNNAVNQSKTNLNLSLALRTQSSIHALRSGEQQSATPIVDPRFLNTNYLANNERSGGQSSNQNQVHISGAGQLDASRNDVFGMAQSISGSPQSKRAGARAIDRENAKNLFAISGQKSDEDEGDLDQFQSSRALRNRKLLGSDEVEQDIESKGEGTSPSKQLKNAFNLKENSKFDMFNRNGRSIQELNELKGAEGEMQIITARSFDEEAQPAFERAANQNSNRLNQANKYYNLSNQDDLKHKSILLTPKNFGSIQGIPEGRDQRHQSMNVSPNKPTPQLNLQNKLLFPGKYCKSAIGSDWTAGAAKELEIEYENTEQKEQKAKRERMREIIERQMNAEYQNSVNKIIDGAQFNQRGVGGQKNGPAQRSRRQSRQLTATGHHNIGTGNQEIMGARSFQDEEGVPLRQQLHQSFNLQDKENEIGSFIHSGPETYKHQASSFIGGTNQQFGENDDLNGFYGNDRLEDGQYQPLNSGARAKYSGNGRSQFSNNSVVGRDTTNTIGEGNTWGHKIDSGNRLDKLSGRPPVSLGPNNPKARDQSKSALSHTQEQKQMQNHRSGIPPKTSNTSLSYSQHNEPDDEIILNQDDINKQNANPVMYRANTTNQLALIAMNNSMKAQETHKREFRTKSAAFQDSTSEPFKPKPLQPYQQQTSGPVIRTQSRPNSTARRSEQYAMHSTDNDPASAQEGARSRGRQPGAQNFPGKSQVGAGTQGFNRSQVARGQQHEQQFGKNIDFQEDDRDHSPSEDDGERAPLSIASNKQDSAEKPIRSHGNEFQFRDNGSKKQRGNTITGFLHLPENLKKSDDRRGSKNGYDLIDDDDEEGAGAYREQDSARSLIDIDQIGSNFISENNLGDKNADKAQQLPSSQRRKPQHTSFSNQSPLLEGSRVNKLQNPGALGHNSRVENQSNQDEMVFGVNYSDKEVHRGNHLTTNKGQEQNFALNHTDIDAAANTLNQQEKSFQHVSTHMQGMKHPAVNIIQKNLSQSNGPQNSSFYKSDDVLSNKQLDEQIVSYELHLEKLKQIKREKMIHANTTSQNNTMYQQKHHQLFDQNEHTGFDKVIEQEAAREKRNGLSPLVQQKSQEVSSKKQTLFGKSAQSKGRKGKFEGSESLQSDMKMPIVNKLTTQQLPNDDADMVSPGLESPRPTPYDDQEHFYLGSHQDNKMKQISIQLEKIPGRQSNQSSGVADSSRITGPQENSQVNLPINLNQMAPSFTQKRIESLQRHQKQTSPPPQSFGSHLQVSPRDQSKQNNFDSQGHAMVSGRMSLERAHSGPRQSSKHESIKIEKRQKLFKEQLIRYFNQKLVDRVVSELKAKAADELGYVEEEVEAAEDDSNQILSEKTDPQQAQKTKDAIQLGRFLFEAKGLDKQLAGQYFGEDKKFNQAVCREFLRCFNFRNLSIDSCWRLIFNKMGLPKEGQQIVRIMSIFQDVYLEKNPDRLKWPKDTVWLVSVKLMDLNTNLHNPNVKPMLRYSRETFVQQSMLIPELKVAFSAEKIGDMYDRIYRQEFQSNVNLHEKYFKRINELSYTLVQQSMKSGMKQKGKGGQAGWQENRKIVSLKRSNIHDVTSERNQALLKTEGTIFTKYGRYGAPKQRLVFLNEDETAICWRDRINKQEKARKLLIKDVTSVLIGADHTDVMRKQKIPAQFDYQYISILAANRSLDLSIDDKATIHLWVEKISRLIEASKMRAQKSIIEQSPEMQSPNPGQFTEAEVQIHAKDACPSQLVYLWKCELLNNLQNYWNPLSKEIYVDQEIKFDEMGLKQAIVILIEQQGGPFLVLTEQERKAENSQYFQNFSSNPQSRNVAGQGPLATERSMPKNAGAGSLTCGLGQKFSLFSSASKLEQKPLAPMPINQKQNKFFQFFGRKEFPITLVQAWYLGLPNIARYCLWPILIGNQLGLNKSIFEQLLTQVRSIRRKQSLQKLMEAGSAKQREMYAGRNSICSGEGSVIVHNNQDQGGFTSSNNIKRASNLSMIISENEKELSAEQYSVFDQAPGNHYIRDKEDSNSANFKSRRKLSASNETNDYGMEPTLQGRPSTMDALINSQNQVIDQFSEHMIAQFNKIQRKVAKLSVHWEKASVIGDLADIPVYAFEQIMNDVLCAFLLHRASINGLQSNISDIAQGNIAFSHIYLQKLESQAIFITGLHKILAPLVLIHMREQQSFEDSVMLKTAEQVFSCFTNLVLSTNGGSASQDQLFFLKHFITDDYSQIEWRMDFFDKLFGLVEPLLHGQFRGIDLKNEYFLHGWMMAMFGNVQGLEGIEFVLRIWDLYLLHGEAIIYCIALSILKSKLHKLNNAPMQNWQDFFHKIKKLKLPQQSLYYPIGNLAQFQSPPSNQSQYSNNNVNQPGTGGSNSNEAEDHQSINFPSQGHHGSLQAPGTAHRAIGQSGDFYITNHDSHLMPSLIREALQIFVNYNVPSLFKAHKMQQLVAEQKHEIFSKMYLNNDDFGL